MSEGNRGYRELTIWEFRQMKFSETLALIRRKKIVFSLMIVMFSYVVYSFIFYAPWYYLLILVFWSIALFLISFWYLFEYKVFAESSRQFRRIAPWIIRQSLKHEIDHARFEPRMFNTIRAVLLHRDSMDVNYQFDQADVFETDGSIFFFPSGKKIGRESKFIRSDYSRVIRFRRNVDEDIPGIEDIYNVIDFRERTEKNDRILLFKDIRYDNWTELRLIGYDRDKKGNLLDQGT